MLLPEIEHWARSSSGLALGYALPDDRMPTLDDLQQLVRASFVMGWEYRCDEQLHRRWVEVRARGFAGFQGLFELFVAAGVLRAPGDPAVVTRLAELVWLIAEFWLASIEVSGETVDDVQMERGVALMLQVLDPYIIR
jgi:hypothetical protein